MRDEYPDWTKQMNNRSFPALATFLAATLFPLPSFAFTDHVGNVEWTWTYYDAGFDENWNTITGAEVLGTAIHMGAIVIPDSLGGWPVMSIGLRAFREDYPMLTAITIPDTVIHIGVSAFFGCSKLSEISLPASLERIDDLAFAGCRSLTSLTLPASTTDIWGRPFEGCFGLASIAVEEGNPVYDSRNNCNAIIRSCDNTLLFGCKNTEIPDSVTSIGDYAFSGYSELTSITIPNGVTSIGDYAFRYCSGLTSITIPANVTSLGDISLGGCTSLKTVKVYPVVPPYLGTGFYDETKIYVPSGSLSASL